MPESLPPVAIHVENLGIEFRRYKAQSLSIKSSVLNLFKGTQYQQFWALRNVSLSVRRGEVLGIVGRNGAGKSTLLRAIAGILPPTEGRVSFNGVLAPLMELGGGFNGELTGRENIFLNGAIMGLSKSKVASRVDAIVEFAELGDFIDSPLSTYSTGMKARLAFAVGTDIDPDILLVDEVFAVGDERFKRKAQERIEKFFRAGKTIIMVSHSLELLKKYSTRVLYLERGEFVSEGPPASVIEHYLSATVNSPAAQA